MVAAQRCSFLCRHITLHRIVAAILPFLLTYSMLTRNDIENTLKRLKPELQERFHVRSIGYFGSFAKGSQTELSDLDLLVEFSKPIGWDFFTLERFLEQSFGIPVDLVTRDALKQFIKEPILREVHYV